MKLFNDNDMIEFAKYAKSYMTARKVEKAFEKYKSGDRLNCPKPRVNILTEGSEKRNIKKYPNGIIPEKGPPPPSPTPRKNEKNIVEKTETYAKKCHGELNQKYGKNLPYHSYSYHLDKVAEVFEKHKYVIINDADRINTHAACFAHDCMEDALQSYNDILKNTNKDIADIVFAVTDVPEKNRLLRTLSTLPKTINDYRAIILKICDICANATYSKETKSTMFRKYREEAEFKKPIFTQALRWYKDDIDSYELIKLWEYFDNCLK
ncbi:MAG: hypothetical protein ACOC33_00940 [bacterium]